MSRTTEYSLKPHFLFSEGISSSVEHYRKQLRKWTKGRKIYRQTFFELSTCTDRQLNDMGIARSDIGRIAVEARNMAEEA